MSAARAPASGLTLFSHPFSSYCQKVLIALYADGTVFDYRMIGPDQPETMAELRARWPYGRFPVLVDDGESVIETSIIIEHLQRRHPGPNRWIPDGEAGLKVRFLDRFFDLYVMNNMSAPVFDALRPAESRDPFGVAKALADLNTAYDWLEANLPDSQWAAGDKFTMADCAAAPSLFYADWVEPIGEARPRLAAYRARLLAHPAVARCVEEARPFRSYFPLGAPDRD